MAIASGLTPDPAPDATYKPTAVSGGQPSKMAAAVARFSPGAASAAAAVISRVLGGSGAGGSTPNPKLASNGNSTNGMVTKNNGGKDEATGKPKKNFQEEDYVGGTGKTKKEDEDKVKYAATTQSPIDASTEYKSTMKMSSDNINGLLIDTNGSGGSSSPGSTEFVSGLSGGTSGDLSLSPSMSAASPSSPPVSAHSRIPKALHARITKTRMCLHHSRGCCDRQGCRFAHSTEELRDRPNLLKTRLCATFTRTGSCPDEENCKFAHGEHELRATSEFYKTALCTQWRAGACKAGDNCRYAHGQAELRTREDSKPTSTARRPPAGGNSPAGSGSPPTGPLSRSSTLTSAAASLLGSSGNAFSPNNRSGISTSPHNIQRTLTAPCPASGNTRGRHLFGGRPGVVNFRQPPIVSGSPASSPSAATPSSISPYAHSPPTHCPLPPPPMTNAAPLLPSAPPLHHNTLLPAYPTPPPTFHHPRPTSPPFYLPYCPNPPFSFPPSLLGNNPPNHSLTSFPPPPMHFGASHNAPPSRPRMYSDDFYPAPLNHYSPPNPWRPETDAVTHLHRATASNSPRSSKGGTRNVSLPDLVFGAAAVAARRPASEGGQDDSPTSQKLSGDSSTACTSPSGRMPSADGSGVSTTSLDRKTSLVLSGSGSSSGTAEDEEVVSIEDVERQASGSLGAAAVACKLGGIANTNAKGWLEDAEIDDAFCLSHQSSMATTVPPSALMSLSGSFSSDAGNVYAALSSMCSFDASATYGAVMNSATPSTATYPPRPPLAQPSADHFATGAPAHADSAESLLSNMGLHHQQPTEGYSFYPTTATVAPPPPPHPAHYPSQYQAGAAAMFTAAHNAAVAHHAAAAHYAAAAHQPPPPFGAPSVPYGQSPYVPPLSVAAAYPSYTGSSTTPAASHWGMQPPAAFLPAPPPEDSHGGYQSGPVAGGQPPQYIQIIGKFLSPNPKIGDILATMATDRYED